MNSRGIHRNTPSYQSEGITRRNCNGHRLCTTKNHSFLRSGQFHQFLVSSTSRWLIAPHEHHFATLFRILLENSNSDKSIPFKVRRGLGRSYLPMGLRERGLHFEAQIVPKPLSPILVSRQFLPRANQRYVCQPHQQSMSHMGEQMGPFRGYRCVRPELPFRSILHGFRQPPVASFAPLATPPTGESPFGLPSDLSTLGCSCLVSPSLQNAKARHPRIFGAPTVGPVSRLPPQVYASSKVAPSLHMAFGQILEEKQFPPAEIALLEKSLRKSSRYDSAFRLFYSLCVHHGLNALTLTTTQVASVLHTLSVSSKLEARNA